MSGWDPKEWENHFKSLVRLHYSAANVKDVPDKHGGDFGLECFTLSGHAFQCYVPEEPLTVKTRYERQRTKIYDDIKKFISNRRELEKLFGSLKISRWILACPRHESAKLVQYAAIKAHEVRALGLSYVASDFEVLIQTAEDYKVESQTLYKVGAQRLPLNPLAVDGDTAQDWLDTNSSLAVTLKSKLSRLPDASGEGRVDRVALEFVKRFLESEDFLDGLQSDFPDLWEKLDALRQEKERFLQIEQLTSFRDRKEILPSQIKDLQERLSSENDYLRHSHVDMLAWGTVADWLLRCPLDFPE